MSSEKSPATASSTDLAFTRSTPYGSQAEPTYSGALSSYGGQRIEFSPLRARPGDAEVTVRSVVRQSGAEPVVIEYDLERAGASWKVFDVRVAGISLVATYRSAFSEHARNHGVDGLIAMLERRNAGFPASCACNASHAR